MSPFRVRSSLFFDLLAGEPGSPLHDECQTYRRELGRLLAEGHEGKYVLIKRDTIIGVYRTSWEALTEADKRFPGQVYFLHCIREHEPDSILPRYSLCRE